MSKLPFFLHPVVLLIACVMIYIGEGFLFFCYLLALIIHEYAHAFIAHRLGYKLKSLCLMPYGAQLNLQSNALRCKDEIMISLAGPLANVLFGGFFVALWWLFPSVYVYTEYFVIANFVTAFLNFLPLVPLDGSRVILALLGRKNKRVIGYKILSILNCVTAFALFILFLYSAFHQINFSLGIIAIFLIFGAFEKNNDFDYCYLFHIEKRDLSKSRGLPIKFFAVHKDVNKTELLKLCSPSHYVVIFILDDHFRPIKTIFENEILSLVASKNNA